MTGGKVMEGRKQSASGPFRRQIVRGEPLYIAGKTLTPVARLVAFACGRGTLRSRSLSGWATGLVRVAPLGMVAEVDGREEWVAVHDATASALCRLLLIAAAATLFLSVVRRLASRRRQPAS
jgi:hypothetical protein